MQTDMDRKALINRKEICTYLGISKNKFYGFLKEGLPVRKVDGTWTGNKEEVDSFFKTDGKDCK